MPKIKGWEKIDDRSWTNDIGFTVDQVNIWKQSSSPKYFAEFTKDVGTNSKSIRIAEANMLEEVKKRAVKWMRNHPNGVNFPSKTR